MDPRSRFEQLLASGKDSALLRFGLGQLCLKSGESALAVEHLKSAVAQDPDYSAAWKLLGNALEDAADRPGAMAAYRSGIEAAGRRGDKQAAKEMSVFLRRLEKASGAA